MGFFDFLRRGASKKEKGKKLPQEMVKKGSVDAEGLPGEMKSPKRSKRKEASGFFASLKRLFVGSPRLDKDLLEEIEDLLLTSDMGLKMVDTLLKRLKKEKREVDLDLAVHILKEEVMSLLSSVSKIPEEMEGLDVPVTPHVVLVIGVNGVGKTTTIGKLAHLLQNEGKRVMMCAGDTFRAAAVEQLLTWGERLQVPVISHGMRKDPGSVAYDAVSQAVSQGVDVLLVDTAGRLHNKVGLMNELGKVKRVIAKKLPGAPQEVLLVVDGSTGQNAWQQAKLFNEHLKITSLAVTKLDGVARGGVVIGLSSELGIPIKYVGLGEGLGDLAYFDAQGFVNHLFDRK